MYYVVYAFPVDMRFARRAVPTANGHRRQRRSYRLKEDAPGFPTMPSTVLNCIPEPENMAPKIALFWPKNTLSGC